MNRVDQVGCERGRKGRTERSGDSQENAACPSIPSPGGEHLRNSRVGTTEILVIFQRDDAIKGHHRERCVLLRVRERFWLIRALRREQINDRLQTRWTREQCAELTCPNEPFQADPAAISRLHILCTRGQTRAAKSITEPNRYRADIRKFEW